MSKDCLSFKLTLAVSFPMPEVPPVTRNTWAQESVNKTRRPLPNGQYISGPGCDPYSTEVSAEKFGTKCRTTSTWCTEGIKQTSGNPFQAIRIPHFTRENRMVLNRATTNALAAVVDHLSVGNTAEFSTLANFQYIDRPSQLFRRKRRCHEHALRVQFLHGDHCTISP